MFIHRKTRRSRWLSCLVRFNHGLHTIERAVRVPVTVIGRRT